MDVNENGTGASQSLKDRSLSQSPTIAYLTCLMITGIVGNTVVGIVYYTKFPYSKTRLYILVMSLVDLLTNVVAVPVEIVFRLRYDLDISDLECQAYIAVKSGLITFSGFVLIAVAIDRYRKVCQTTEKQFHEMKAVGVCMFLTIFTMVPTTLVAGRHTLLFEGSNVTGVTCFVADDYVDSTFVKAYAWSMLLILTIGSLVMSLAYARIAHCLLKNNKIISQHIRTGQLRQSISHPVNRIPTHTTLMMYILTTIFVINFLPYLSLIIMYGGKVIHHNVFQIFLRSYFVNSSANPFVYGFCSARFRKECFKLFTFRFYFEDSSSMPPPETFRTRHKT